MRGRTTGTTTTVLLATLMLGYGVAVEAQEAGPTLLEEEGEGHFVIDGTLKGLGSVVFGYQDEKNHYVLALDGKKASFAKVAEGKRTPLGLAMELPPGGEEHHVAVQRGPWRMVCTYDRLIVARAWDDTWTAGKVGCIGGAWEDVGVQPVDRAAIRFSDSHMRKKDSLGSWEVVSGSWRTLSLEDSEAGARKAELSANAFSLVGSAEEQGLTVSGDTRWFWSNYVCETAVRCADDGAVGLVFDYQDPDNYLLYKWTSRVSSAEDGNRQQLVEVAGGTPTVLAEKPGGHLPDQWYLMRAQTVNGTVRCFIDDQPQLSARAPRSARGQFGLFAERTKGATFDDAWVEAVELEEDDFSSPARGKWIALGEGKWQIEGGVARCRQGRGAYLLGLRPEDHYVLGVDVQAPARGAAGLAFGQHEQALYALLLRGDKVALVGMAGEEESVYDERAVELKPKTTHRLKLWVEEEVARGYVDDELVVEALLPERRAGRIGLCADQAAGASFDNVYFAVLPGARTAELTAEFTDTKEHFEMAEWSDPSKAPWIIPGDGAKDKTFWSKGDYYGDTALELSLQDVGSKAGSVVVRLNAREDDPRSGLTLTLSAQQDNKTVTASLREGGAVVAQGQQEAQNSPAMVRVARRGSFVVVSLEGQRLLAYRTDNDER